MTARFETWVDLFLSGLEHEPGGVGFGVLREGAAPEQTGRRALVDRAQRVSRGLRDLGVGKGSVVVLQGEPSVAWAATFAAVLLAGGMPTPIGARSTGAEFERVMSASGAEFAVVSAANPAIAGYADTSRRIVTFEHSDGAHPSVPEMYELEPASPERCEASDPGVVLQTSGTTGNPKFVVHSHRSHLGLIDRWTELTMTPDDRVLCFLPLNHQGGLLLGWISAFSLGVPFYQLTRFSVSAFWDAVRTYGITWTGLMDPVPAYLLAAEPSPQDREHSLRFVTGSRKPNEVPELQKRFGIRQMRPYGSTESTIVAMSVDLDRPQVRDLSPDEAAACAGPALTGMGFRITQLDGSEAPRGVTGSLEVTGTSMFSYYLNNPDATSRAFTPDGWFRTGDRAYVNEHNELFFVERAGNSIRRSGENISAAEVETILMEFPGVAAACVLPVPDDIRGQEVRACIVRAAGSSVTAQELFDHCLASLSKFKVPRYIDFWAEFPRTGTFKISRGSLDSDPHTWIDRFGTTG